MTQPIPTANKRPKFAQAHTHGQNISFLIDCQSQASTKYRSSMQKVINFAPCLIKRGQYEVQNIGASNNRLINVLVNFRYLYANLKFINDNRYCSFIKRMRRWPTTALRLLLPAKVLGLKQVLCSHLNVTRTVKRRHYECFFRHTYTIQYVILLNLCLLFIKLHLNNQVVVMHQAELVICKFLFGGGGGEQGRGVLKLKKF